MTVIESRTRPEGTVPVPSGLRIAGMTIARSGEAGMETIVSDVALELARGETLGIVGESGSGKSLTAKAIIGLLPRGLRATGLLEFDGRALLAADERELRALRGSVISMVMQDPFTMLHPIQTVGATLAESLTPEVRRDRDRTRREVTRRLAEVGLEADVARRRTFELSGGMRQRVGIAAALAKDPALLIADEPTTALDVSTQAGVLRLLGDLQRSRGMSLLLITHDLGVAFGICDRIMVMYAGSVMEVGRSDDLRDRALHPYTRALRRASLPMTHVVERFEPIPGNVPRAGTVESQCPFAARCDFAIDRCRESRPDRIGVSPGHDVACIRIEAVRAIRPDSELASTRRASSSEPASAASSPIARVTDLVKSYGAASGSARGRAPGVAGVSFDIAEGEALGLVGETGSGKSTIARCMMGLTTPDAGEIVIGGLDASDYRRLGSERRREVYRAVQMVFQDPYASLNPKHSIGATLEEALEVGGRRATEVVGLLDQVGLPGGYAQKLPHALSGGERQRVAIARALAIRPQLLICDEPVAALDVSVQAQILELLRSVQAAEGMAMLFITHDLAVVRQMTTRLLVCHRGEIVESGATEEVLDRPAHPYTRRLRDAAVAS